MKNTVYVESIQKKKDDSKEFAELLKRIPPERKSEVLGLVTGFVICVENESEILFRRRVYSCRIGEASESKLLMNSNSRGLLRLSHKSKEV